ncbi:two-component regulator propeller domain-containing protein [Algibacter sp. L4_22]|uniref:hybrid sensor histidine kinase/response regulator transcription factor n=1 Tax=Algibacter sp. L4_22 TaxID=2942477 RepID=UPI00201B7E18|nr:two-component regulator propeller domain-containing protein [Algibacter sp. L4_22]MCL5130504.1 response regulator [Algibacter sp. L4_22]
MRLLFYIVLFSCFTIFLHANNDPYISICKVTPDGGVAYSQVTSILEDDMGFIWFSTNNGVFAYNSTKTKRYSHVQNNDSTIPSNRINKLYKDHNGNIWVATENGLCEYQRSNDYFKRYSIKDNYDNNIGKNITSIFQDNDHTFWFSDENGFGTLDLEKNRALYKKTKNTTGKVSCISIDDEGTIWVFYNDGDIYFATKGSNTFQFLTKGLKNLVRSVLIDKDNIWIGYEAKGLLCVNKIDNKKTHYSILEDNPNHLKLPSNQVRSLLKDENNRIWVATYNGITLIKDFKVSHHIDQQKYSELPNHSIWSLYKDSQQNIWIGTWMGGLAFHSAHNNSFIRYNQSTTKRTLNGNIVSCFAQVPNSENVLIGLDDGGINYYTPETNVFKNLPINYQGKAIKNIKSLAYDKNETLWVGTYGNGVLYREKGKTNFERLAVNFETGFQALDILTTNTGVWVSDYPLGAYFYNFETKATTRSLHNPLNIKSISNNKVHFIIEDKEDNVWFATQNGLNLLKKGSDEFIHYFQNKNHPQGVSHNYLYCIHEDSNGFLWLGTNGGGLDKFDPKTGRFENYNIKNGLPGNEVFSILEDDKKNLWLTTENGLCKFDTQTNIAQSYITNNSLQSDLFHPTSALKAINGDLFFGGSNGVIRFSPSRIIKNPKPPKTNIISIKVNNENIPFSSNTPLKLHHTQNFIGFEFTSNNYINPKKNIFKYRLLGFNDQWIETDYTGKANFTNIPPNHYVFEVKSANNDGVWNLESTKININIIPPIWARWYAYVLYLLAFIASIYYFRKQVINRQNLRSQIKLEKIHRENEEQLHQMKLQFFTNISHEFRTPLTLIQGPVNRLLKLETNNPNSNKQLELIKNNTDRLLRLINQFLDFRRADSGKLKLLSVNTDIIAFCKNVFYCFEEHALQRGINFHFISEVPNLKIDFDTDKLDKVLVNMLSNAFKYSPDNTSITLTIKNNKKPSFKPNWNIYTVGEHINEDYISINISDFGYGISEETLPQIFERFYQTENNYNRGTGIGLSLSTNYIAMHNGQLIVSTLEGEGSAFCICIPQHQPNTTTHIADTSSITQTNNFSFESSEIITTEHQIEEHTKNQEALILITEDNLELLEFLSSALQNHFRIATAKNGKEAYQQIHTLFPDLVISDIMMPEMDGIELCAKIKNDIRISHTPVILLTALDTIKDRISGINSGADLYVPKPFNEDVLIAQIHNLLNSRKALRSLFSSQQEVWKSDIEVLDLDKKFLLNAISVVEQNISNPDFSVEDLTNKLHLSRTHLHRKLTSLTNQSATEFIRSLRLKHAVELMKTGDYLVNEIGFAVGFNSHNYFSKSFKKQYGKTPSEFIKANFDVSEEKK